MQETAVFSGGCFWCMESLFDKMVGVMSTASGYMGGHTVDPTYEEVCKGNTGHREVVKIVFDSEKVSYSELLKTYWHHIDPADPDGQFCDKGEQYKSAIFYADEQQRVLAEKSKEEVAKVLDKEKIYTEIRPMQIFYPAEGYHQGFYWKDPVRYKSYSSCSGRIERLHQLWGKK